MSAQSVTGLSGIVGGCLRVVPSTIKEGALADWLAAHKAHHTPPVRRQPGFIAKVLLQAENDPNQVAMLLLWHSSQQAIAWTKHPEHDASGEPLRPFTSREGGPQTALPRGGYKVLEVVMGGSA
jgi:hypothetical protein